MPGAVLELLIEGKIQVFKGHHVAAIQAGGVLIVGVAGTIRGRAVSQRG